MQLLAHDGIRFSVLLPTRGRVAQANRFLESLARTAARPACVEVLLAVDADDPQSAADIGHPGLRVRTLVGPPGRGMGIMTNALFDASRAPYILLCGDDNVFRTPGWDLRVLDAFARFPDEVALVYANDLLQGSALCTAPFLSRTACELMGGPCPPTYRSEYIDTHLMDVFLRLEGLGHARRIYLPDVVLEHMHPAAGKAAYDATYAGRLPTAASGRIYQRLAPLRAWQAEALARHIHAGARASA